jgi:predicted NAD/FAD-binding protein
MRIGVIGGGVAGLTATWLLQDRHEVTLLERQPRLGGHAYTVDAHDGGVAVPVEAGFEFFSAKMWPSFNRLLQELGLVPRDYTVRIALHRTGDPRAELMQPMRLDGSFAPRLLTPSMLSRLTQFGVLLASVAPLMRARDTSVTLGRALDRVPLTRSFRDDFLFPFLLSSWCVEPDEFREFAAYDVLRYSYLGVSWRGGIAMREVPGGMRAYIAALAAACPRATLRTGCEIAAIERDELGFHVRERDGRSQRFDQLVLATNARDAVALLDGTRGAERARALLSGMRYFETRIAVHGDSSLMPARPREWSIVNVRHDGRHAQMTVWKPWRAPRVFRSWVSYDARMPEPLHELIRFEHPAPTCSYFEIQRALGALQGQDGLWLAGMYMHDVDSHESALMSAVNVAERLDPAAPRLAMLRAREGTGEPA